MNGDTVTIIAAKVKDSEVVDAVSYEEFLKGSKEDESSWGYLRITEQTSFGFWSWTEFPPLANEGREFFSTGEARYSNRQMPASFFMPRIKASRALSQGRSSLW